VEYDIHAEFEKLIKISMSLLVDIMSSKLHHLLVASLVSNKYVESEVIMYFRYALTGFSKVLVQLFEKVGKVRIEMFVQTRKHSQMKLNKWLRFFIPD